MSKDFVVLGASGRLGFSTCEALEPLGTVLGVSRRAPTKAHSWEWQGLDLSDHAALRSVVEQAHLGVIYAAGYVGHEQCDRNPTLATLLNRDVPSHLAALCAEQGQAFVLFSTDAVFDGSEGGYTEESRTRPFSLYGESKLAGERSVADIHGAALILRTNFYGWFGGDRNSILDFFVDSIHAKKPSPGYSDYFVSSAYAPSIAQAAARLIAQDAHGLFHLAASQRFSKYEFGCAVARQMSADESLIISQPAPSAGTISRRRDLSLRCDLVEAMLGYRMPTLDQDLHRAFEERAGEAARHRVDLGGIHAGRNSL